MNLKVGKWIPLAKSSHLSWNDCLLSISNRINQHQQHNNLRLEYSVAFEIIQTKTVTYPNKSTADDKMIQLHDAESLGTKLNSSEKSGLFHL